MNGCYKAMSRIKILPDAYEIKPLSDIYLPELLKLQENAFLNLENEELLRRNSDTTLRDCLVNHYTLGAIYKGILIAFGFSILENLPMRILAMI